MNSLQFLFLCIGLISLAILCYSIRIFIKLYRCKEIAKFPLDTQEHQLKFISAGLYSISFIGCRYIQTGNTFNISILSKNGKSISLNPTFPNMAFYSKGIYGVEYWKFKIQKPDTYTIQFKNIIDLKSHHSQLYINRLIKKYSNNKHLKISIKETVTTWQRIFSIIGLVIGINGLALGIMIGVFNMFN